MRYYLDEIIEKLDVQDVQKDDKVVVRDIFTWDELTVDKADLQPCDFDIPEQLSSCWHCRRGSF